MAASSALSPAPAANVVAELLSRVVDVGHARVGLHQASGQGVATVADEGFGGEVGLLACRPTGNRFTDRLLGGCRSILVRAERVVPRRDEPFGRLARCNLAGRVVFELGHALLRDARAPEQGFVVVLHHCGSAFRAAGALLGRHDEHAQRSALPDGRSRRLRECDVGWDSPLAPGTRSVPTRNELARARSQVRAIP